MKNFRTIFLMYFIGLGFITTALADSLPAQLYNWATYDSNTLPGTKTLNMTFTASGSTSTTAGTDYLDGANSTNVIYSNYTAQSCSTGNCYTISNLTTTITDTATGFESSINLPSTQLFIESSWNPTAPGSHYGINIGVYVVNTGTEPGDHALIRCDNDHNAGTTGSYCQKVVTGFEKQYDIWVSLQGGWV